MQQFPRKKAFCKPKTEALVNKGFLLIMDSGSRYQSRRTASSFFPVRMLPTGRTMFGIYFKKERIRVRLRQSIQLLHICKRQLHAIPRHLHQRTALSRQKSVRFHERLPIHQILFKQLRSLSTARYHHDDRMQTIFRRKSGRAFVRHAIQFSIHKRNFSGHRRSIYPIVNRIFF